MLHGRVQLRTIADAPPVGVRRSRPRRRQPQVVDGGKNLLVMSYGSSLSLLGKNYVLTQILFHRPAEMTVAGKVFDMDVQLFHRGEDGKRVIVSIPLERGAENPVIQTVLNNLPLERSGEVEPPMQSLDIERLLPDNRAYQPSWGH